MPCSRCLVSNFFLQRVGFRVYSASKPEAGMSQCLVSNLFRALASVSPGHLEPEGQAPTNKSVCVCEGSQAVRACRGSPDK
jgi:hypothetical protein